MLYKVTGRYGSMGLVGIFLTELSGLKRSDKVVLKTERGSEVGEVMRPLENAVEGETADGEVLRVLTSEDEKELERIAREAVPKQMAFCRDRIKALDLPMKLVDAEHLLGGEKVIFYFLAEGRVDFRQLVKDIAREYKTRIELRQIGVRDEARLLAELGHCGQCLCCRSFIKSLEPVTMRMAKSQKATLDPTKISGVCGRLMCCLRYEDRVYSELKGKLPKRGSMIETRKASGKVVDTDVLAQVVTVRMANSNIVRVHISDIISPGGAKDSGETSGKAADAAECCGAKADGQCPKANQQQQGAPAPSGRSPRRRGRRGRSGRRGGGSGKQDGGKT